MSSIGGKLAIPKRRSGTCRLAFELPQLIGAHHAQGKRLGIHCKLCI